MRGRGDACVAGGHVWQGRGMRGKWGGMHAGETVTEADGTHPTGMYSLIKYLQMV